MITNNLSRLDRYDYHNKRFQSAFDFLRNSDLLSLTPGTEISVGDGVLAKIQEYTTDPEETRKFGTTPPPAVAMASNPARTVLPTACAICSSRCPALRAAAFVCWNICRWAACWVCCFARCWAAVMVGAGGLCADWRGTVAVRGISAAVVFCAVALCSVPRHISRWRTCAAVVSCRCRTFWARYLCRTYFR